MSIIDKESTVITKRRYKTVKIKQQYLHILSLMM